eukprot:scaffold252333_cov30-Tisochrysis_lutea.AAC.2
MQGLEARLTALEQSHAKQGQAHHPTDGERHTRNEQGHSEQHTGDGDGHTRHASHKGSGGEESARGAGDAQQAGPPTPSGGRCWVIYAELQRSFRVGVHHLEGRGY